MAVFASPRAGFGRSTRKLAARGGLGVFVVVFSLAASVTWPLSAAARVDPPGTCNHYSDCDDADPCNGLESCTLGVCALGPAPDCDDKNPCTDDFCKPGAGCINSANRDLCSDGNVCNGTEFCAGKRCHPGTDPLDCNDGNECTTDTCDVELGCAHVPSQGPCGQSACIEGHCVDGECRGEPQCDPECEQCVGGECKPRQCEPCVCDMDNDGGVTAADALAVLVSAVRGRGLRQECPVPTTTTTTTTSTTTSTTSTTTTTTPPG
jgi:hypothetical protein